MLNPVNFTRVKIDSSFWNHRLEVNRQVTIPFEYEQCRNTGRLKAFKLEWQEGMPDKPHYFWDSDVAKWLEAVAYSLAVEPDQETEDRADALIEDIAAAQQTDGYLNSYFTQVEPENRWHDLRIKHELYCAGHLIEAAVALNECLGKDRLLDVMCRYADYIDSVFGPEAEGKISGYPGHEEIELALIRLYRHNGNQRYLKLACFFLDQRGTEPNYFLQEAEKLGLNSDDVNLAIFQAHLPVRQQLTAEGHAVRAGYLYTAMAGAAAETGDNELMEACRTLWRNITEKRMYVTGGIGSSFAGERFSVDYDLPNETAYAESCAQIALVFFAHKMLQAECKSEYADVIERLLYNGVLPGVSQDGKHFFYINSLAHQPEAYKFDAHGLRMQAQRPEWHNCACCPPNIARILASLGSYIYSEDATGVYVHQYIGGMVDTDCCSLQVVTRYPWDEDILLKVIPKENSDFKVCLRLPDWCRSPQLAVNGEKFEIVEDNGYAVISRSWKTGDEISLVLPMSVEFVEAHPAVRHCTGKAALQRGPLIYCFEENDNGGNLNDLMLSFDSEWIPEKDMELDCIILQGHAWRRDMEAWCSRLYRSDRSSRHEVKVKAVPYFMWGNRKPGEMIIWTNCR